MSYSVSEIFEAIRKAEDANTKPVKILINKDMVQRPPYKDNRDQTNEVLAKQVFGIPMDFSDGFVVIPSNGQMAVWNHKKVE